MLTEKQIKALEPSEKQYKVTDAQQLYLIVTPHGSKLWRMNYKQEGKQMTASIGTYPKISLKEAREKRDELRLKLRQGIDISARKKHEAPKLTQRFEKYALEWHAKRKAAWSEKYIENVLDGLKNHAFPMLGDLHPASVTPTMVLACIQQLERQGKHETAKRVYQRIHPTISPL